MTVGNVATEGFGRGCRFNTTAVHHIKTVHRIAARIPRVASVSAGFFNNQMRWLGVICFKTVAFIVRMKDRNGRKGIVNKNIERVVIVCQFLHCHV
jgi:chemotaxis signal transduction protein